MKATKKLLALVLAVVMIMAMAVTASAVSVTIENAQEGTQYKFYQLFEYDEYDTGKYWYKVIDNPADPEDDWIKDIVDDYFALDSDGYILSKTTSLSDAALAAELKTKIPTGATSIDVTAPATPDLPLGYYLMISGVEGAPFASLAEIKAAGLTIREKNTPGDLPYVKKTYDDGSTVGAYNIGDTVKFKIVVTLDEGATAYNLHDLAQDLTVDTSSIVITLTSSVDGAALTRQEVVTGTGTGDTCTFHVELEANMELKAYDTITIEYEATVTGDNPTNQAWLNVGGVGGGDPGTSNFTYGFTLNKTDGTNQLNGAEFILSRKYEGVTQYGKFTGGKLTGWTENEGEATPLAAGSINVSNLGGGQYTLTEKTAPIGYKKLGNDIIVTITPQLDTDNNPTAKAAITATGDGVTTSGDVNTGFTVSVKNDPIGKLPETGGMGTTVFYVLGGLMVAAALVLLTSKKRMAA